jgi:hypothetical protein
MDVETVTRKCPKCGSEMTAGEKFCAACGSGVAVVDGTVHAQDPAPIVPTMPAFERDARLGRARKWLFWISLITLVSGFVFFAIAKSDCEKQIDQGEAQLAGLDPEVRDARLKANTGMTWDEIKAHDRGLVTLLLVINIGLATVYLGMWFWAKRNPLAASVTALLLFITVIVVNGVYEPSSIPQGFLVKIFFTVALAKAISAAQEERRIRAAMPQPT